MRCCASSWRTSPSNRACGVSRVAPAGGPGGRPPPHGRHRGRGGVERGQRRTSGRHGHASRDLVDALEQTALDVLAQAADRVGPAEVIAEDARDGVDDARDGLDEAEQELSEEVDGVEHDLLEAHPHLRPVAGDEATEDVDHAADEAHHRAERRDDDSEAVHDERHHHADRARDAGGDVADDRAEELGHRAQRIERASRLTTGARREAEHRAELAELLEDDGDRVLHRGEHRLKRRHRRAEGVDGARDDVDDERERADEDLDEHACDLSEDAAERGEVVGRDARRRVGRLARDETQRLAEPGERADEGLEHGRGCLDGGAEALSDALEEALDAEGDLIDADEERLESRVLGAVQLVAHRAGEAALLEELHEPSKGELDAVPHAREEVGDAADVVPEGDNEARHHRREHAEDEDGREDGGHQPTERDARRLEPDEEQREARLGRDDRADQRDDDASAHDKRGERALHRRRKRAEDVDHAAHHLHDDGHERLEHLREGLAKGDGERLERAAEELLLPLEGVEHLLAEVRGGAARVLELVAQVSDGRSAAQRLARVRADAAGDLGEDGVHAAERLAAEGREQERRALRLAHSVELRGEVAEDVEEAAEAVLRVDDGDAHTAQRLLHARIGHALHRDRDGGGRALDAGHDVLHEAERDERLGERLMQRLRASRGGAERQGQLARVEREHVDRLEHAVDRDGSVVRREAKRLHRLRREPRRLRGRELAEGARGEVEHRVQKADGLGDVVAGGGEVLERLRRLRRRELRGEPRRDGGVAEPRELGGRRARDRARRGDSLLEPACRIGERERCPHRRGAGREDGEAHAELLERALDVLGAEPDATVEAHEVALEVPDGARREVARGEDEAEAEVVEGHGSLPPSTVARGLLQLLRLPRALAPDPLEEPVAIGGR